MRKKLNAALDKLENTTLKDLDEIRTALKTSLKKDVDNCSRLKDELQLLGEAVQDLHENSKREIEFISGRKCLDKIQESQSYLKETPVKVQCSIIFKENIDIMKNLSKHFNLGKIVESMQSLRLEMIPAQVVSLKRKSDDYVKACKCAPTQLLTNDHFLGMCCPASGKFPFEIDPYDSI
ncbi:hypothetical protein DPMN_184678 [Dreissena polymorpha]|uniref:Uncharacterized protein n=1 Tax=Dreissena polymorpha TaxID=45954 RepID=A0A9D4I6N4_DREPO|nr:hypothetical protein DPMN_184678 [Dreissena polymorpha]